MTSADHRGDPDRFRILGIPVSVVDLPRATEILVGWAARDCVRTVFVREVASLMAAVKEKHLADLHDEADLVVADGMPLVWVGKMRGFGNEIGRVPGADLVASVCSHSLSAGQSHYFFGGKPGVAEKLAACLTGCYPGLRVAGTYSPPMRTIGSDFELDAEAIVEIERIRQTNPDFVWVGISSPKQEFWIMKAAPLLGRGVIIGVGAAFDFHSGTVKRAPRWMRDNGLEWAHRLFAEPRRLWWRYLVLAPQFVLRVALELSLKALRSR